ncbi:MAG: MFS transporter [Caldilineales bacterium]|nr:MFS transporter [Caldilineales bacterium]
MKQRGVLFGRALVKFLLLVILVRLVRDTSVRMMYPYLPVYARGLGITLAAMGTLLAFRTAMLIFAPYFGHLADHTGSRRWLIPGYFVLAVGLFTFSFANGVWAAALAFVLLGVSDALITPLMQAYVSDHSPPHRRGRSLVMVEYSWAITGIIIVPVVGWLITVGGWQAPFRVVGVLALLSLPVLYFLLPADEPRPHHRHISLSRQVGEIRRDRSALSTVLVYAAIFVATEVIFVIWGAHLDRDFHLDAAQIGQIAAIMGFAELGGSVISSLIIDRTGKRRALIGGMIVFIIVVALMPFFDRQLVTLVIGLALASLCIEYTVVTAIPLMGQQMPGSRATMFAMGALTSAISRSVTDSAATALFDNSGFLATMWLALVALLVGFWLLWRRVEERAEV